MKSIDMITKKNNLIVLGILILFAACKKDSAGNNNTNNNNTTPPKVSQMSLLCNTWVLKETYENDVKKTSNGTGQYRFTTDGKFKYYTGGKWEDVGTWNFNDKDSNSLSVLFIGTSMSYWWYIKKLDATTYNSEFNISG